jgi:predicted TIM-barrel fold metal-dependent hydrolase
LGERGAWAGRRSYYPEDGWDRSMGGTLGSNVNDAKSWLRIMDDGGMETVVLYPTGGSRSGGSASPTSRLRCAGPYNNFVHQEFLTASPRLKAVALLPFQDVGEAVKELRRAVTELGCAARSLRRSACGYRWVTPISIRSTPRPSAWGRWWPATRP